MSRYENNFMWSGFRLPAGQAWEAVRAEREPKLSCRSGVVLS